MTGAVIHSAKLLFTRSSLETCFVVRFELNLGRHVIGKLFSTFFTVDLDTSMSANRFTTELFAPKKDFNHMIFNHLANIRLAMVIHLCSLNKNKLM